MENINDIIRDIESANPEYKYKNMNKLVDIISDFGFGETEFHTADISILIQENQLMRKIIKKQADRIASLEEFYHNNQR